MRRQAFPSRGISFLRLRAPNLCSIQASVPYPLLWPRLHWRLPRRRLGRETVLPLVWRDSTMVGRTGMTSGLQMPANILPSTWRTSSMCGRKVGICLLFLRQNYLVQLLCRCGFVLLWYLLAMLSPLLLVPCLGWPLYLSGTLWTPRTFQPSPWMRICSDLASCCKSEGYQRFPWGLSDGRLPIGLLPTYRLHRLERSSQSNVWTFPTWQCSIRAPLLGPLIPLPLRTRWGTWSSGGKLKLRSSIS